MCSVLNISTALCDIQTLRLPLQSRDHGRGSDGRERPNHVVPSLLFWRFWYL